MSKIDTNKLLEEVNAIDAEDIESADGVVDVSDEIRYLQQLPELDKKNREEKRQLKSQLKSAEDLNDKYLQILAAHGINPDGTKAESSKSTFSNLTSTTLSSMTPTSTVTFSTSSNLQPSPQQSIQTQTMQPSNDTFSTPTSKSTTSIFSVSSTPLGFDSFDLEKSDSDDDFLNDSPKVNTRECANCQKCQDERIQIMKRTSPSTNDGPDARPNSNKCCCRKSKHSNNRNKKNTKHGRRAHYKEYSDSECSYDDYSNYSDYSEYYSDEYSDSYDEKPRHKPSHSKHTKRSSKPKRPQTKRNKTISKNEKSTRHSRHIAKPPVQKTLPKGQASQTKDAKAILADFEKFAAAKMEEMEQMIAGCGRRSAVQTSLDEMAANARYKENIRKVETALYCHPQKMDIIAEVKAQFAAAMRKEGVLTSSAINGMIERAADAVINSN